MESVKGKTGEVKRRIMRGGSCDKEGGWWEELHLDRKGHELDMSIREKLQYIQVGWSEQSGIERSREEREKHSD